MLQLTNCLRVFINPLFFYSALKISAVPAFGPDGFIIIIGANQSVATAMLSVSDIAVNGYKVEFVLGSSSNPILIRNRKGIFFYPI